MPEIIPPSDWGVVRDVVVHTHTRTNPATPQIYWIEFEFPEQTINHLLATAEATEIRREWETLHNTRTEPRWKKGRIFFRLDGVDANRTDRKDWWFSGILVGADEDDVEHALRLILNIPYHDRGRGVLGSSPWWHAVSKGQVARHFEQAQNQNRPATGNQLVEAVERQVKERLFGGLRNTFWGLAWNWAGYLRNSEGRVDLELSDLNQNHPEDVEEFDPYRGIEIFGNLLPQEVIGRISDMIYNDYVNTVPLCEECYCRHNVDLVDHLDCEACGITLREGLINIVENTSNGESFSLCTQCLGSEDTLQDLGLAGCYDCDEIVSYYDSQPVDGSTGSRRICESCYENNWSFCEICQHLVNNHQTYMREMRVNGSWLYACDNCYEEAPGLIHEWNYRPELNFHPWDPEKGETNLYIGIEIECSWSSDHQRWVEFAETLPSDLLYCKEDSSVNNGFEIVSHPMQPRWALENFPFHLFTEGHKLGMLKTHDSTGTHIHMGKEAFTPTRLWKFIQLHARIPEFIGKVGGRGTNNRWGSFELDHDGLYAQRRQLMEIVKKKGGATDYNRYCAVNLRNEYTIELRYMKGSTEPSEIKKNIEWALALYEYSGILKVADLRKDPALDDAGYFLQFIRDGDYPNLNQYLDQVFPQPKKLRRFSN